MINYLYIISILAISLAIYFLFKKKRIKINQSENNRKRTFIDPKDTQVSDAIIMEEADTFIEEYYKNKNISTSIEEKTGNDYLETKSKRFYFPELIMDNQMNSDEASHLQWLSMVSRDSLKITDDQFVNDYIHSFKIQHMFDTKTFYGLNDEYYQYEYFKEARQKYINAVDILRKFNTENQEIHNIVLSSKCIIKSLDVSENLENLALKHGELLYSILEDSIKIKASNYFLPLFVYKIIEARIKEEDYSWVFIKHPELQRNSCIKAAITTKMDHDSLVSVIINSYKYSNEKDIEDIKLSATVYMEIELLLRKKKLHYIDYTLAKYNQYLNMNPVAIHSSLTKLVDVLINDFKPIPKVKEMITSTL